MPNKKKLGDYIDKWHIKKSEWHGREKLQVLGVSNVEGITITSHKKSKDLSNYLVVEPNAFAYNPYRINVGSIGLTPKDTFGLVSPAYTVFKVKENKLIPELLLDYLKSFDGLQQINKYARGTVRKALRYDDLCEIEVNFPEYEKQNLIFEKKLLIEQHSWHLINEIQSQKTLVTQLKQSILQEAIQGRLTKDWRKLNPNIESGKLLLEKIVADRISEYKKLIDIAIIEGIKKPKKPRGIIPLKNYIINEEFTLPSSWGLTVIDKIGQVNIGSTPERTNPSYWNGDINWVSSGEVANNYIESTKERITVAGYENTSLSIYPKGSVLVAMIGQGKTRGQTAILKIDACTNQNVAGIIINQNFIIPEYLWILFLSRYEKSRSKAKGGNQAALNGQVIGKMPIPIPPLEEQKAIVAKVEALIEKCNALEQQITQSEQHAQMLMQAVLKEAFEGNIKISKITSKEEVVQ